MPTGLGDEKLWISATNDNTGTSTAFDDQSGNNNDGTASGVLVISDTNSGGSYAYDFDGVDDYIDFGDVTGGTVAVSAWIVMDTNTYGDYKLVFGKNDYANNKREFAFIVLNTQNLVIQARVGSNWRTADSGVSPSAGVWYHVYGFVTSGVVKVSVNGASPVVTSFSGSFTQSDASNTTGATVSGGSTTQTFDGRMDDIRVYDRELTQSEITHLASQRGVEGPPPVGLGDEQLWLCPSLNDSANDISGNGNDGTLVGGTAIVSDSGQGGTKSFETYTTSTDRVDIPAGVFTDGNDVSFSVWVKNKQTSAGSKTRNIFRTSNNDIQLYANQTRYRGRAGGVFVEDPLVSLNTTDYYHYVLNYDSAASSIEMFRNGVSVGTVGSVSSVTLSGTVDLLQNSFAFVDDVRAYNRTLTQAEITHLASQRGVEGPPPVGLGDEQLWLCPSLNDSASDISGNGNDGSYQGGMGTVADTSEGGVRAYDFDGTADYIRVPKANFDFLIETNSFSKSVWVRSDASSGQRAFVGGNISGNKKGTAIYLNYDGTFSGVRAKGASPYSPDTDSATNVPLSQWFHIAWVVDGATSTLYLDGSQIFQETGTFTTVTGPLSDDVLLGCFSTFTGTSRQSFLDGLIDDVRIYDRPLTQAEVTHLASQRGVEGPAPVGLGDEQLWLCPSLNDSASDISGNGNDGAYQGGMGTVADTSNGGSLAYDFDGTDDFISLGDITSSSQAEFCVSAWVKRSNSDSNVIMAKRNNTDYQWDMSKSGTAIVYFGPSDNANRANSGSTTLSLNQWDHVTCQVSATQVEVYINGTLEGTHAYTGGVTDTSASMTVGRRGMTSPNEGYFTGYMDDIRTYNRVLTQAEITHLATSRGIEGSPSTPTTQYNAFITHAFTQLFQQRLR